MATVLIAHVELDDARPLGPQIAAARRAYIQWKLLEHATGYSRRYLYELMTEAPRRVVPIRAGSQMRAAA